MMYIGSKSLGMTPKDRIRVPQKDLTFGQASCRKAATNYVGRELVYVADLCTIGQKSWPEIRKTSHAHLSQKLILEIMREQL